MTIIETFLCRGLEIYMYTYVCVYKREREKEKDGSVVEYRLVVSYKMALVVGPRFRSSALPLPTKASLVKSCEIRVRDSMPTDRDHRSHSLFTIFFLPFSISYFSSLLGSNTELSLHYLRIPTTR